MSTKAIEQKALSEIREFLKIAVRTGDDAQARSCIANIERIVLEARALASRTP